MLPPRSEGGLTNSVWVLELNHKYEWVRSLYDSTRNLRRTQMDNESNE